MAAPRRTVQFPAGPGWHSLRYRIGLNECGQSFEFKARGQYNFRLLPTCGIERTDPDRRV